MISWYRILFYLGLAVVEATPSALLLTVAGADAWGALVLVVLAGVLADWIILRRLRPAYHKPALAAIGIVFALWVVKGQVANLGPLVGWDRALAALSDLEARQSIAVYLSMLLGLYCFWRGTRLTQHDSVTLHRLFRISMLVLIVVVFIRFFSGGPGLALAGLATTEVISFFAVALLTIALASAAEEREIELRRMGWRGLATLVGAIALVMFLGILIGALFGREAAAMIRLAWGAIVFVILLILTPFLYLLATIVDWLIHLVQLPDALPMGSLRGFFDNLMRQQNRIEAASAFPAWVEALIRGFCAIVPILLIISLFLIARRRTTRKPDADEERESLWSWSGLANDLRSLLAKLGTTKRAEGLRDALARLRGDDPISRIRRSYIKLLLIGEERSQPRLAPQTPHEYASNASTLLPAAAQAIAGLTDAYERARYHPTGTSDDDAEAAERAASAIDQADKQTRR